MNGNRNGFGKRSLCALFLLGAFSVLPVHAKTSKKNDTTQLRSDYIAKLREQDTSPVVHTVGSLWSPESDISSLSVDYKARKLNDTLVILVAVQTTAAQSADVNSQRAFQTSSGITGLAGDVNTKGVNSLFNANSNTSLKGSGATDSTPIFKPA